MVQRSLRRAGLKTHICFLRADEIQAFFAALAHEETPQIWQDFFAVALLTGARRSNVLAMKWADLELERGLWKIAEGESKNKEPLLCVLAQGADADTTPRTLEESGVSSTEPAEASIPPAPVSAVAKAGRWISAS